MTCNDCIHFDACRNLLEAFSPEYKGKSLTFTKACKHFKNKADFVEMVRCRDCVFRVSIGEGVYTYKGEEAKECVWHNRGCYEDDFCSSGIRKERRDT